MVLFVLQCVLIAGPHCLVWLTVSSFVGIFFFNTLPFRHVVDMLYFFFTHTRTYSPLRHQLDTKHLQAVFFYGAYKGASRPHSVTASCLPPVHKSPLAFLPRGQLRFGRTVRLVFSPAGLWGGSHFYDSLGETSCSAPPLAPL